ncbi:hypothetical protein B0T25DRAFT_464293 [Lasiosphaeria hispida]|uniref:Hsp70 family chaperone n=1 Tax=Lasiosphaeria hispida TaxID=260671 RepID=A0AAJ0M9I1_9PEZI|nr:hypothetical protein B0T25DRAFT_464293 [Lasiosphaeria hispida]
MSPTALHTTRASTGSPRPLSEIHARGVTTPTRTSEPPLPNLPAAVPAGEARVVIALDYGTTFTEGVAYLSIASRQKEQDLDTLADDIRVIQSWEKHSSEKVPSDFSYSPSLINGCQQWGYDIDDNSRVIKWTKLSLEDTGHRGQELENLTKLLYELRLLNLSEEEAIKNNIPRHLSKEPEDIVKDYLEQVADKTLDEIISQIGRNVPDNIPIDMVITHPAKWSDRALNSTYRAVCATFTDSLFARMRNISFVSEPEACAHYTLRVAWRNDHVRFRKNDCFIVVDAGGGTVDLASYKVVGIDIDKKQIKLQQIGVPIGNKCGATFIDTSFTDFVRDRLGEEDWSKLTEDDEDNATGGHNIIKPKVRMLHERFEPIKHQFDGKDQKLGWPIQLPRGIGSTDNDEKGILNGAIKVTADDLRAMFQYSVDKTLVLISQAVTQIDIAEKLKVRKIFLSGGFGQSPYLYERVKQFGKMRRIDVERGEDCWAAVAKGAIIKSLGLYTEKLPLVRSCPRHYGIKIRSHFAPYKHQPGEAEVDLEGIQWATDQIRWFIQKGDAIFPNKPIVATYDCHWSLKASDFPSPHGKRSSSAPQYAPGVFREVVFIASAEDDAPMRFDPLNRGRDQVITLTCDLTKVPLSQVGEFTNKPAGKYLKFWVKIEIHVFDRVQVKVVSGDRVLASQEVPLGVP